MCWRLSDTPYNLLMMDTTLLGFLKGQSQSRGLHNNRTSHPRSRSTEQSTPAELQGQATRDFTTADATAICEGMKRSHRRTAGVGRDLWRSDPPAQTERPRVVCPGPRLLNISKEGDSSASLRNLFQCLVALTVRKCLLIFRQSLPCFGLCHV